MNSTAAFRFLLCALFVCLCSTLRAQRSQVSLGGEWHFALDPVQIGAEQE